MLDKVNFKTDKNFVVVNLRVPHAAYEYHYAHRQAEFRKFLPDNPSAPRNIYATNAYDNALLYMDDVINELIERFVAQAGDKSYSIYITADHGQLFNFQGRWGHGQLLLETAKVPFFYYHQSGTLLPPIISHYQIGKLIALDLGFMVLNPNEYDNTFYVMENNLFFNTNFIKYRIDGNQLIELKRNNVINLKDKLQKSIY
jgi:membrane-anchored protein YejM (alkaline phosphatase superfamily)